MEPLKITPSEWREIMNLSEIIQLYGTKENYTVQSFSDRLLGVKFHRSDAPPNSPSDLYILCEWAGYGIALRISRYAHGLELDE